MKRLLNTLLVCALMLSLTVTSFAATRIDYTFYDDVEGYTYHFGTFDEDDVDAGVIINGKEYTLDNADKNDSSKTAFEVAKEHNNKFGIGFMAGENFKEETYTVTPYAKDADGNVTTGKSVTSYTAAPPEYSNADLESLYISGIKIDIARFDENNQLTCTFPDASDGTVTITSESITATANKYATVSVLYTEDDGTCTITVTAGDGTTKTYTVNIVFASRTRVPFYNTEIVANVWAVDATTTEGKFINGTYNNETIGVYGTKDNATLEYNNGNTYQPTVALVELDLSELENLDTTKDTYLYMYGYIQHNDDGKKLIHSMYDVTGENLTNITIEDLRNYQRWTKEDDLILTEEIATINENTPFGHYVNINSIIEKYYGTEIKPVIAFYVTPVENDKTSEFERASIRMQCSANARTAIKYFKK